jgi:hypothetical protein
MGFGSGISDDPNSKYNMFINGFGGGGGASAASSMNPYLAAGKAATDIGSGLVSSIGAYYAEMQRRKERKEDNDTQRQQFQQQAGQKAYSDERALGMQGLDYLNSQTNAAQKRVAPSFTQMLGIAQRG